MHPPHAEALDRLGREPLIDGGPLGRVEVRCGGDDLQDFVLGQFPGAEESPDVVEPEVQVPRAVQPTAPLERRDPARHGHLGDDLPLDLLGLHITDCPYGLGFSRGRSVLVDLSLGKCVKQLSLASRE